MVDKLPISTVFFSGCLNHQQYHQMLSVYQLPWHGLVYRWSRWTPHTPLLWRQVLGLRGCSGATLGCGRWWLSGCSWGRVEDGTGKMVRLLWRFVMFCSYLFPLTLKHSSIYQLLSMWKHRCPKWGVTLKLPLVCWIWFDSISCSRSLCWFVTRYPWLQQKFLGGFFLNCRKDAKIYFECLLRCWKFVLSKSCRSFFDQIWNPCLQHLVFNTSYHPWKTPVLALVLYIFCAGIDFTWSIGLCFGSSCWNVRSWGRTCWWVLRFTGREAVPELKTHKRIAQPMSKTEDVESLQLPQYFILWNILWAYQIIQNSYSISYQFIWHCIIHYFMYQIHILYAIYCISSCQIWNICGVPRVITPHGLRWKLANALGWKLTDSHAEAKNRDLCHLQVWNTHFSPLIHLFVQDFEIPRIHIEIIP